MEVRDSTIEQSTEVDYHWVHELFPPRFTFQDLLEDQSFRAEKAKNSSMKLVALDVVPSDLSRRRMYVNVLKKVQEKEEKIRRSTLAKNISKDTQARGDVQNKASCEIASNGNMNRRECIWNDMDLSKLRTALCELEWDRWRLREQLRNSEEQMKIEREARRRMEELLKEHQKQLACSRKEAAHHALLVKALKMEVCEKDNQLKTLNKQSQEKTEDAGKLRVELRRTREKYHQIQQELSDLAWQLEKIKVEQKMEVLRQMEEARLEQQVAILRLQTEVEEAHTELRAEKENHGRSLTALELLRHHFSNQ